MGPRTLVGPWWNPRKTGNQDPNDTLGGPWKKRKIETLVGPLQNLKSGTRYRSGTIRLKRLVLM